MASEQAAASVESRGVRVPVVRLPQVHDSIKQALVTCRALCGCRRSGLKRANAAMAWMAPNWTAPKR